MSGSGQEGKSLPTASEGLANFDFQGVFRELHDAQSREAVTRAQELMGKDEWKQAEDVLKATAKGSTDPHDVRNIGVVLREVNRFQTQVIPTSTKPAPRVPWENVWARPTVKHAESFTEIPQSVFMLRHETPSGPLFVIGRRLLSHQYRSSRIRELHCSLVTASMLLGPLSDQRLREDGIVLYYKPLTNEEKLSLMAEVTKGNYKNWELVFPFPVLKEGSFKELECPPGGWEIDEPLAEQLGQGEVIIRQYSLKFLSSLGRDDLILYDPACSTGQFLSSMRQACPKAKTIGQDLSPHMARYASKRLDEIHCGDALYPKVPAKSVDVVFVRFVNSEVVKTHMAMPIVTALANTVKPGGHMIIFGHTPVLVSSPDLKSMAGWKLVQCIGGGEEWSGVFQYYVMKRDG